MSTALTWKGTDGGSWTVASNWADSTGATATQPPGPTDFAQFISFSGTVTGSVGTDILYIGPGSALTLGGSGFFSTVTIGADFNFNIGTASFAVDSGQVVSIGSVLSIGASLGGSGTVVANGTLAVNGGIVMDQTGIPGTIIVNNGGSVYDGASLTMEDGGLIEVGSSGAMAIGGAAGSGTAGALTISNGFVFSGEGTIAANVVDDGSLITFNAGYPANTLTVTGNISGTGSLSAVQELDIGGAIGAGVKMSLAGNGGTNLGLLRLAQPQNDAGTLVTMSTHSTIALTGETYDSAIWTPGSLTMTGPSGTLTLATAGDQSFLSFITQPDAISGTDVIVESAVPCFLPGTLIRTDAGEVPVEHLRIGDTVMTLHGGLRRLTWIGLGRTLATQGRRTAATPVIVRKGALADNVPHRDLYVTKGHSLFLNGVLIPAEFLVNHRSILWDDRARAITVFHLELDAHDILFANGAEAESYRDDGNRWLFQNANSHWGLSPQPPCAPVLTGGAIVDDIWQRLLARAGARPGLPTTDDPDLHLLVDGRRVDGKPYGIDLRTFHLSQCPASVRIVSRASVPAELGLVRDSRVLGVALRQIIVSQGARLRLIDAGDARLTAGFHGFEADDTLRWTNGDATLPPSLFDGFDGPLALTLRLAGRTTYIDDGPAQRAA